MTSKNNLSVLLPVLCLFLLTTKAYDLDVYESSFSDDCEERNPCKVKESCCDSSQLPVAFSRLRETDTLFSRFADKKQSASPHLSVASAPELPAADANNPRAVCLPDNYTCCMNSNKKTLGGCPPDKIICCLWQLDTGYSAYGCCKYSCSSVPGWCDGPVSFASMNSFSVVLTIVAAVFVALFM